MKLTRRSVLGISTTVGAGTVAGCLGSGKMLTPIGTGSSEQGKLPEAPVAGEPDADVTVTVYEDFAGPFCQEFELNVFPQLEEAYLEPERIRYEFRNFPIPSDETWSWALANAAREIYESWGDDAFWRFVGEIYEHQRYYTFGLIEIVANELDLDGEVVRRAAERGTHRSTIERDRSAAIEAGITRIPTVLVDGEPVAFDDLTFEQFAGPIDAALEQ